MFSFFFQAEDGIRDGHVTWSLDVCSSDLKNRGSVSTTLSTHRFIINQPLTKRLQAFHTPYEHQQQERAFPSSHEVADGYLLTLLSNAGPFPSHRHASHKFP